MEAINAKANDLLSKVDLENIEKDEYEDFALIFWTKGSALNNLNKYEDAFNSYLKSYEIIKKSQNDFNLIEIKSLYGLAWSSARLTRYEQSLVNCNKFIDLAIKKKCLFLFRDIYVVRGVCNKELGNLMKSQKDFHVAKTDLSRMFEEMGREMEFSI